MDRRTRFWLGVALLALGALLVFVLGAMNGTVVALVGVTAVLALSSGTILAGIAGRTV